MNDFREEMRPPLFLTFMSYHIMILLGSVFILLAVLGIILLLRKKAFEARWFHKALIFAVPLPYLANEFGWIAAEVGRQPWVVYRVLRTSDAVSVVVPAGNILFTLILFIVVYALLAVVGLSVIFKLIKKGPEETPVVEEGK